MKLRSSRFGALMASLLSVTITAAALAQSVAPLMPARDVLTLDATVATEVVPDLAVITLAAEANGIDAAPITREVQQAINAALTQGHL